MEGQTWTETASIIPELEGILARREEVRGIEDIFMMERRITETLRKQNDDARLHIQELTRSILKDEENATAPSEDAHAQTMEELNKENASLENSLAAMKEQITAKEQKLSSLSAQLAEESSVATEEERRFQTESVPRVRHAISLYRNITHISWKYDSEHVEGFISCVGDETVREFSMPVGGEVETAKELWALVERATGA